MSEEARTDDVTTDEAPRGRSWGKWGAIGFIPFLGVLALVWLAMTLGPADEAQYALVPGGGVDISRTAVGYEFAPTDADPEYGVILYPGGRVSPDSYATLGREFVEREDALFVITPMTIDLAILSPDTAAEAVAAHPEIDRWVLVGHSLGGVAACQFVAEQGDAIDALVLLASYPDTGVDLSGAGIPVWTVTASEDLVLDVEAFEAGGDRLPAGATYVEIDGGNHAQFGSYGDQPGDGVATIDAEDQRSQVIDAIIDAVGASAAQ